MSNLVKFKHSKNWYIRFMYQGKLYQQSAKTQNKKLAQQMADKYFEEVLAGVHNIGDNVITVEEAFRRYAKTRPKDKNARIAVNFMLQYLPSQQLVQLTDPIMNITSQVLEKLVEARRSEGKKESTTAASVDFIVRIVNWAKKNGYSVSNLEKPKITVKNGRLRYLSIAEEERLLVELDPHRRDAVLPDNYRDKRYYQDNYDLCVFLLDTGARLTEITTLKWSNIDLKAGTISLYRPKVGNESVLHMTNRVRAILQRRHSNKVNDFIFNDSADGHKKSVGGIRDAFKRAGLKDMTIHGLRHTCASRLIQNGMSLYEVSHILGHTNLEMTKRYAHIASADVTKKARDVLERKVHTTYIETPKLYNSYTKTDQGSPYSNILDLVDLPKEPKNLIITN